MKRSNILFRINFLAVCVNNSLHASMLFVAAVIFLFSCSTAVKTKKEKDREIIMNNKIKSVTEYATASQLGAEEKEYVNHVKWYNEKGLNIKETVFFPDGETDFFATHEYNENDKLILTMALRPDSSFFYKKTFSYDANNNLIEKAYFEKENGTFYYKNVAVYDSLGRMIEYYWWWPTGLRAKNYYSYDGMKMKENVEYDMNGEFTSRWINSYDKNENLIESVQYYPDSLINSRILKEYDEMGVITRQTEYYRGDIRKILTFQYNEKSMLIGKVESSTEEKITATFRYQYEFF